MIRRITSILLLSVITGVAGSIASAGFIWSIGEVSQWLGVVNEPQSRDGLALLSLVLVPAAGGIVVGLISHVTRQDRPLGLVDVIHAAQAPGKPIPLGQGYAAVAASIVALGSGASVGQYGPLAHMGATISATLRKITGTVAFTPAMALGCGVAAAISMAFNAPIAGLVFAHEVVLRHYSLRSFAPITVAAVIGHVFANYVFDQPPIFGLVQFDSISSYEFLVFSLIGLGGALVAIAFMHTVLFMGNLADRITLPDWMKPGLAGAILGIVAIWIPEVLGIGDSVMKAFLSGNLPAAPYLIVIFVAKICMTALCLGFGFAGGVFSPALFIGICFGGLVVQLDAMLGMEFHMDAMSLITAYTVCGMVAVASPVIGAPLTGILMVFELTRSYELAVAAMISVVFANLVSYRLFNRSLFDQVLHTRGVDLSLGRDKVVLQGKPLADWISEEYVAVDGSISLADLEKQLVDSGTHTGFVVDRDAVLIGQIGLTRIAASRLQGGEAAMAAPCAGVAEKPNIVFTLDHHAWDLMEQMQGSRSEAIAVVDDTRRLVGVVYGESIMHGYMAVLNEIRREEHGV